MTHFDMADNEEFITEMSKVAKNHGATGFLGFELKTTVGEPQVLTMRFVLPPMLTLKKVIE